jgi:hypothetical protein
MIEIEIEIVIDFSIPFKEIKFVLNSTFQIRYHGPT